MGWSSKWGTQVSKRPPPLQLRFLVKASAKDEKQNAAACFENQKPYLVGGIPTYPSEKIIEFVSWDDDIPNWMEIHKQCSKPPTRYENSNWTNKNGVLMGFNADLNGISMAFHADLTGISWVSTLMMFLTGL